VNSPSKRHAAEHADGAHCPPSVDGYGDSDHLDQDAVNADSPEPPVMPAATERTERTTPMIA
jgi:hypothetical protein